MEIIFDINTNMFYLIIFDEGNFLSDFLSFWILENNLSKYNCLKCTSYFNSFIFKLNFFFNNFEKIENIAINFFLKKNKQIYYCI
jgi:hypothetical protein